MFLKEETTARKKDGLIDTKAVSKPPLFSGREAERPGRMFKFSTWIAGQFDRCDEIFDWAGSLGEEEVNEDVLAQKSSKYPQVTSSIASSTQFLFLS